MAGDEAAPEPAEDPLRAATLRKQRLALLTCSCLVVLAAVLIIPWATRDSSSHRTRTVGAARTRDQTDGVTTSRPPASRSTEAHRPSTTGSQPHATPAQPPSSSGARSFTMLFAGDLLPHGPVNQVAAQFGQITGQPYDFDPLLAAMKPLVSSADLAICHMETPVAPNQAQITTYPVFGAPVGLVKAIRDTGYDGCSTASNQKWSIQPY